MALFKYPKSEEEDSFIEKLGKMLLTTGASAGVEGLISGSLGNYFQGKMLDKQNAQKTDLMERMANQENALAGRAEVKELLKDMPDRQRAWTIYQGLKDNPEMLTANLGGVKPALPMGPELPSAPSNASVGAPVVPSIPPVGPELPLPDSTPPPSILASLKKPKPGGVPFTQSLKAVNPIEQYAQEDPKGFAWWNRGPEARREEREATLAGTRGEQRLKELEARGTSAAEIARIRSEGLVRGKRIDADAKVKAAVARKGRGKGEKLADNAVFQAKKTIYNADAAAERAWIPDSTERVERSRKDLIDYAMELGASDEEIADAISSQDEPMPKPRSAAPKAQPAAPQSGRIAKARAYLESKGKTGFSDEDISEWISGQDPAKLKEKGI
jgi:hypothetical protein